MTQPADFNFGEEAVMLRDSARKFFDSHMPIERLHALVAGDSNPHKDLSARWEPDLWREMADLGWTMLAIPESAGGLGMGTAAVAGLCEEAGRAAFPSPLLATLNCASMLSACGTVTASAAMEQLAGGAAASYAGLNAAGSWEYADTGVTARNGKLYGAACFVQDAQKAGYFLVKAREGERTELYWVAADATGVQLQADAIVDLTRDQARVSFDGVKAESVSTVAVAVLREAMPALWTMVAADMVGAGEWQLQTTVEYAKTRRQFGRELGFFQAVKHPLVKVMTDIDQAKSLVYNAACAVNHESEQACRFAHMAKASASDMAAYAFSRSVQFHGGIGFTWECYVHIYFKRQMHNQMLWGDGAWHRAALADLLIGQAAA